MVDNGTNDQFDMNEDLIYCSKCGYRYKSDFLICPQCGAENINKKNVTTSKSSNNIGVIILGVVFGLIAIIGLVALFSNFTGINVKYIGDRSAQFNDDYKELQILFSFQDNNENRVASDASFEIEIINDNNEIVYQGTKEITKNDFGNWSSPMFGERFLGCVRIPENEIIKGSSAYGKVHFTVYKDNVFSFDESIITCTDLPVSQPILIIPSLPINVSEHSYFGTNTIKITSIEYETTDYSSSMTINLNGEKVSGDSGYTMFNYKILDDKGTIVDSGTGMTSNISNGDKFQEKIYAFDTEYGKTYTLELSDYNY